MKTIFSRAQLTSYYAQTQLGKHKLKEVEHHYVQHAAVNWYNDQIPKSVHEARLKILKDHGFTEDEWKEILQASGSFYFTPPEGADACNKDIRELLQVNTVLMNGVTYSSSVHSGHLMTQIKRGTMHRQKIKGVYRYYLPRHIFNAIDKRIKQLYS